jgi:Zn-dependent protease/CBS domain-containing protein
MRQTVRLGRILGIPVGVHWSALVIALLLAQGVALSVLPAAAPGRSGTAYWTAAGAASVLFLASLLAHEMSHAVVARHYRVGVKRVTLWLLGGVAELEGDAPHPRADLLIALAGPATSVVSGILFLGAAVAANAFALPSVAVASLGWLAAVNVLLAVFNLLPGAPLDGGRVLRAAIWWRRGDRAVAQRTASRWGVVLGMLLVMAGAAQILFTGNLGGLWLALVGWFLMSAANAEQADAAVQQVLRTVAVRDAMRTNAGFGYANQTVDAFVDAVARHRRERAFPVIDVDGAPVGVVDLAQLARLPEPGRGDRRLRDSCVPPSQAPVVSPDQPLADAARRLSVPGPGLALVVADGRVVGVLGRDDLARALHLATLSSRSRANTG